MAAPVDSPTPYSPPPRAVWRWDSISPHQSHTHRPDKPQFPSYTGISNYTHNWHVVPEDVAAFRDYRFHGFSAAGSTDVELVFFVLTDHHLALHWHRHLWGWVIIGIIMEAGRNWGMEIYKWSFEDVFEFFKGSLALSFLTLGIWLILGVWHRFFLFGQLLKYLPLFCCQVCRDFDPKNTDMITFIEHSLSNSLKLIMIFT